MATRGIWKVTWDQLSMLKEGKRVKAEQDIGAKTATEAIKNMKKYLGSGYLRRMKPQNFKAQSNG